MPVYFKNTETSSVACQCACNSLQIVTRHWITEVIWKTLLVKSQLKKVHYIAWLHLRNITTYLLTYLHQTLKISFWRLTVAAAETPWRCHSSDNDTQRQIQDKNSSWCKAQLIDLDPTLSLPVNLPATHQLMTSAHLRHCFFFWERIAQPSIIFYKCCSENLLISQNSAISLVLCFSNL